MAGLPDYLSELLRLAKVNTQILDALEAAFTERATEVTLRLGSTEWRVPSFTGLDGRIRHLEAALRNLTDAPLSGEAAFDFAGATRRIICEGVGTSPMRIDAGMPDQGLFRTRPNPSLRDMLQPEPYVELDLSGAPVSCRSVVVRKACFTGEAGARVFAALRELPSAPEWADIHAASQGLGADSFRWYDTEAALDHRSPDRFGEWRVKEAVSSCVDDEGRTEWVVECEDTDFRVRDEQGASVPLMASASGPVYVTCDTGRCRLEAIKAEPGTNRLTLRDVDGSWADMAPGTVLAYWPGNAAPEERRVRVPLEEDKYICVFLAPVSATGLRAPWGKGLLIETPSLKDAAGSPFDGYYNEAVANIGDKLSSMGVLFADAPDALQAGEKEALEAAACRVTCAVERADAHITESIRLEDIQRLQGLKENALRNRDNMNEKVRQMTVEAWATRPGSASRADKEREIADARAEAERWDAEWRSHVQELTDILGKAGVDSTPGGWTCHALAAAPKESPDKVMGVEFRYRRRGLVGGLYKTVSAGDDTLSAWTYVTAPLREKRLPKGETRYAWADPGADGVEWRTVRIPISEGEALDVQARYIYTHGFPWAPLRGAWGGAGEAISVPVNEKRELSNIRDINADDATQAAYRAAMQTAGVTGHMSDGAGSFSHGARAIASGFIGPDGTPVTLEDKLRELNDIVYEMQARMNERLPLAPEVTLEAEDWSRVLKTGKNEVTGLPEMFTVRVRNPYKHALVLYSPYVAGAGYPNWKDGAQDGTPQKGGQWFVIEGTGAYPVAASPEQIDLYVAPNVNDPYVTLAPGDALEFVAEQTKRDESTPPGQTEKSFKLHIRTGGIANGDYVWEINYKQ